MPTIILDIEINIILALQALGGWLTAPMLFLSFLGSEQFYLLIIPAIYWCFDNSTAQRLAFMLLTSGGLNNILKLLFCGVRPYWYSTRVMTLSTEPTFGMPSGHAMNAAALWGLGAVMLRRRQTWIISAVVIFLIGLSRMYLAVHFPTQVLAGWLAGALLLVIFMRFESDSTRWITHLSTAQKLSLTVAWSLGLVALAAGARLALVGWQLPLEWLQNSGGEIDPVSMKDAISAAGTGLGFFGGAIWLAKKGHPNLHDSPRLRLVRYFLGVISLAALWLASSKLLPVLPNEVANYALQYVRYAFIGLWISYLAPLLFARLGLLDLRQDAKIPAPRPNTSYLA